MPNSSTARRLQSLKINSLGKTSLGVTSRLFILLNVGAGTLMFPGVLAHRERRALGPTRVTAAPLQEAGIYETCLTVLPRCAYETTPSCLRLLSSALRKTLGAWERWNPATCRVRVQTRGARDVGGQGTGPRVLGFHFLHASLPLCFSGSEADFSSSSSTGSISAPEVHMSAAGSKRSSFSRK